MSQHVPATVAIRRSRVANIDSDRLARRRAHLIDLIFVQGGGMFGSRIGMAQRAAELVAIRDELIIRADLDLEGDRRDLLAAQDRAALLGLD